MEAQGGKKTRKKKKGDVMFLINFARKFFQQLVK